MPQSIKIRGIAPPDLAGQPEAVRRQFWGWVAEIALKVKDGELARGLDANGSPLRAVSAYTRKHRKSAMTPSGKGEPSAPPLMPARQRSRTRSLLAARAFSTHAELYWRYDPFTGDTWATVLNHQREAGRDVFGVSAAGMVQIQRQSWQRWAEWKRGGEAPIVRKHAFPSAALGAGPQSRIARIVAESAVPRSAPVGVRRIGTLDTSKATFGIGRSGGQSGPWSGGVTEKELRAWAAGTDRGGSGRVSTPEPTPKIPTAPKLSVPKPAPKPVPLVARAVARIGPKLVKPKPRPEWVPGGDRQSVEYIAHARRVIEEQDPLIEAKARKHGVSAEEFAAKVAARGQDLVNQAEVYVRVKSSALAQLVQSGRFKTGFETGTGEAMLDAAVRKEAEGGQFGLPQKLAGDKRPIYGYLAPAGHRSYADERQQLVSAYGDVQVRLKPDVRRGMTVTFGDSLARYERVQASMANRVNIRTIHPEAYDALYEGAGLEDMPQHVAYIEAQMHGTIRVSQIESVMFGSRPSQAIQDALDEAGIPWQVAE